MNRELVEATLNAIASDLKSWDQSAFLNTHVDPSTQQCRTTMCFAGHALVQAGYTLVRARYSPDALDFLGPDGVRFAESRVDEAAEVLGFSEEQVEDVFFEFPSNWDDVENLTPQQVFDRFAAHVRNVCKEEEK